MPGLRGRSMRCPVCDQEYGHTPGCPEDIPIRKTYCITYKESIIKECVTYARCEEDAIENFNNGIIYNEKIIDEEDQIEAIERTN